MINKCTEIKPRGNNGVQSTSYGKIVTNQKTSSSSFHSFKFELWTGFSVTLYDLDVVYSFIVGHVNMLREKKKQIYLSFIFINV